MPSISIAMSLRGQLLSGVKNPVSYSNFIPSGSDSLITADSLTFKSRASAVPTGEWVIVGTVVESAPLFDNPDAPSISGGVLNGPAGIYRVVNATLGTDTERTLTPPTSLSSFSTPGDSLTIYYLQFSSQSPEVILPSGFTATETWSSYANGNTFTQLDAAYARTSTNFVPSIATDANGPAGLACAFGISAGAVPYLMHRDDITAELATRLAADKVQALVKMRTASVNTRVGFGWTNGTIFTGMTASNISATNSFTIMTEGDIATSTNKTDILTGQAANLVFWLRFEVEGAVIRGKVWADGAGEPGTWTQTRTHSGDLTFDKFGTVCRVGAAASTACLGYSLGVNTAAPSF